MELDREIDENEPAHSTDQDGRATMEAKLTITRRSADADAAASAARGSALGWLARQLAWERQLLVLREDRPVDDARHEAA